MSENIKILLQQAPFSFVGTILRLGAAVPTISQIVADESTAVVRIDEVLHAPDPYALRKGSEITVQLATDRRSNADEQFAFYATGLAFGKSVALAELTRRSVASVQPYIDQAHASGETPFSDLLRQIQEEKIKQHLRAADAVVVGSVVAMEKAIRTTGSEHDPDWWWATINIRHVEHGDIGVGKVRVLYANSSDVRWREAPKPKAGQAGVWALHRTTGDIQSVAPFQILDPKDYQTTDQLDLLRQSGG